MVWRPRRISSLANVRLKRERTVARELGIAVTSDITDVARSSNTLILAIKPAGIGPALDGIRPFITKHHIVISIAAGVKLSFLESHLPQETRVVRVMPNQPCMVGAAASAFSLGKAADPEDERSVQEIFSSVGMAFCVDEKLLDAVTGLSGSGPAYVYLVIESMAEGGVLAGLPRDLSIKLAAQTVLGAAKTVLETNGHPAQLKDTVTSPAGTTIEGLKVLEVGGVRGSFIKAVEAASKRSIELGKN